MTSDVVFKLLKAKELNSDENPTLNIWFQVLLAGNDDLAGQVLDDGLKAEHFRSTLPDDLRESTKDELATLAGLRATAMASFDQAAEFLAKSQKRGGFCWHCGVKL